MVEEQLIPRGITSKKVLEAFLKVERHLFVPEDLRSSAYNDYPLPIGQNQTISQPYMVALMTESLKLAGNEKILEIGTGSGYQAAILAEITKEVYSVERLQFLAERAVKLFDALGYNNIKVKVGDGSLGWEEFAPFDRIIVTAFCQYPPETLLRQLKDGGKLIIPLGEMFGQVLTLIENIKGEYISKEICGCAFVPLIGEEGWEK